MCFISLKISIAFVAVTTDFSKIFAYFLEEKDNKFNRPKEKRNLEVMIIWSCFLGYKYVSIFFVYACQILLFVKNIYLLLVITITGY